MGCNNGGLQDITNRLMDRAKAYGMEISAEISKIMTSSTIKISSNISMNGQKVEEVTSFEYLGATLCKDSTCSAEVRIMLASVMAAMARLNRILQYSTISLASKAMQYKSLSASSSSAAVKHGPCLLTPRKGIQAFETNCLRKLRRISYLEHTTNDWMQINFLVGPQEPLLATVKRWKLAWFWCITHHNVQPLQNHPSGHLGGWTMW